MIYEIAGLKVGMEPQYSRLARQSAAYLSSGKPDFRLSPESAAALSAANSLSPEDLEYISFCAQFCRTLPAFGRFFLHASAIVCDGAAYLFSAPSGTGKSTHTAFWRQLFPESYILNDDKPVIFQNAGEISVFGTPFSGKSDLQVNARVPLAGICFLKQAAENHIREMTEAEALAHLLNNTWRPRDNQGMIRLLDMAEQVVTRCNIYELLCTRSPEAAKLSSSVMKGT